MTVIKKGTEDWKRLNESALPAYNKSVDYEKLQSLLEISEVGDIIKVNRKHSHRSNLVQGLSRRGLIQKEDYDIKASFEDEQELILITKLDKPE